MQNMIIWPLTLSLIFSYPYPLRAAEKVSEKAFNQYMVESIRDLTIAKFVSVRTGTEAIAQIVPMIPLADQPFVTKHLKTLKKFPKITALNRGFAYDVGGERMTFVIDDAFSNKFLVNQRVPITYSRENSLEVQLATLAKGLKSTPSALLFDLFFPKAYGVIDWIAIGITSLISLVIGGMLMPSFEWIRNDYVRPRWDAWYCQGKDPNDFANYKSCGDYFAFQAKQRPSIPDAKPTSNGKPVMPLTAKPPKCYSTESPTFTQDFANADESLVIRRTIKYKGTKAIELVETVVNPASNKKLIYKLNDAGQFTELYEDDKLVLTRDPKKKEIMTPDKYKELEIFDKAIEAVLASLKLCDEAAQTKLQAASEQDGSLVAKHVLTSETGSVPAGDAKESPPTTK
jgi:hypothetical protein